MFKPQTMIIFAGCLLAGIVIVVGVSFFGTLTPKEQYDKTHSNVVTNASAGLFSNKGPEISGTAHAVSVSALKADSALKTTRNYSTW